MRCSESTAKIAASLAKAQAAISDPPQGGHNPHYKSTYARLIDGIPLIRAALGGEGIAFVQGVDVERRVVVTRLSHASGEWIETDYPISLEGKPQAMGSALSYARRYSLFALAGVAPGTDDDGNEAQGTTEKAHAPQEWTDAQRKWFCGQIAPNHYDDVKAWALRGGMAKPSAWDEADRRRFVADLRAGKIDDLLVPKAGA